MANEQEKPAMPKVNWMQAAGFMLFLLGLGLAVFGFFSSGEHSSDWPAKIAMMASGGLLAIIGAIMLLSRITLGAKKRSGKICASIGLPFVIIASVFIYISGGGYAFSGGGIGAGILLIVVIAILIISVPITAIGTTLYFVGRSQEKKQKNQNMPPA